MSATLTRLILCFGVLIGTVVLYILVFVALERTIHDDSQALLVANVVTGLAFAAAWTLAWRGQVKWPTWRIWTTVGVLGGAMLPAIIVGVLTGMVMRHGDELPVLLGGMAWVVAWLVGSALLWRETAGERIERLQTHGVRTVGCPQCGYNLTGLKSTTCPECGAVYTIDQLVAEILEQQTPTV